MDLAFTARLVEWRGPAPFYFLPVPEEQSADIQEIAAAASYGWGVIPVEARVSGGPPFSTSLFPKDGGYLLPVKAAVRTPLRLEPGDEAAVSMTVLLRG